MLSRPLRDQETVRDQVQNANSDVTAFSEVLAPTALAKHLRLFSDPPWNWGAVKEVQLRVLKCDSERRCTMEIGLRSEKGWHSLVGKVYATDRTDVFQAMGRIRQAGFGPQNEFSIPQPLAYLSSLRLLVMEKVEGPRAGEIFRNGDEGNCVAAAERCARWLARFHAIAPRVGPVFHSHRCLSLMRRRSLRIGELGGPLADKAARLLKGLEDAVSSLSPVEMCAGHGSYSSAQVVLADGRTVVLDWDRYDVADPARDLGRFLTALRHSALNHLGSIKALDAMAEVFLRSYLEVSPPGVSKNLPFYKAAACLKIASNSATHRQDKTEAKLNEGLRILEEETMR